MDQQPTSYSEQLLFFVRYTALPTARPVLWRTLGVLLFSALNFLLDEEIWPHTPQAAPIFMLLLWSSLLLGAWVAADTAKRIARAGIGESWQLLWKLIAGVGYTGAVLLCIPYIILLTILIPSLF